MTMNQMIQKTLKNASPAEVKAMKRNDISVAIWLAQKSLPLLTESQAESLAMRILESLS